jgi:hypothetical protein
MMMNRLRAVTLVLGIAAALTLALLGNATAQPAIKNCSTAGLRYSQKQGGVTLGVAVANLKAKGTTCATARSIAAPVAKDILKETKVPATIAGFKVTVKEPCAGCTPDSQVTAKYGGELVTFTVKGGA